MSSWQSLTALAEAVNKAQTTAGELVAMSLAAIDEQQDYHAVICLTAERAKARASAIDRRVQQGENAGRLAGIPFIAKDNFLVFGADTTAASNMLKGLRAPYQATAIARLEAEGAICVAKANLDAFAHGASTENSDFAVSKNPHDKTRVPGGSSGGSAAAVVLGLAPFALGTDTGGSIRQPASFSGCVGFKPTYGLVSRSGVVAMASSLDVIGPLTNSVSDAGLVLDVMAGRDELDSTTIETDGAGYADLSPEELAGKHLGIIREYFDSGLSSGVKRVIESAIERIRAAGAEVNFVSLPSLKLALPVYYIICPAEISSNLARYDGQRYGYSDPTAKTLEESYLFSRGHGFGREAKRRIIIGTYVLSSGYYDAYYKKAQTVRTKIINEFNEAFAVYDILLGPTAPTTAFKIGEKSADPLSMYLSDVMTVAANLTGCPAISLPAGESQGLPVGLQLMGPQRSDRQLLKAARAVEELMR